MTNFAYNQQAMWKELGKKYPALYSFIALTFLLFGTIACSPEKNPELTTKINPIPASPTSEQINAQIFFPIENHPLMTATPQPIPTEEILSNATIIPKVGPTQTPTINPKPTTESTKVAQSLYPDFKIVYSHGVTKEKLQKFIENEIKNGRNIISLTAYLKWLSDGNNLNPNCKFTIITDDDGRTRLTVVKGAVETIKQRIALGQITPDPNCSLTLDENSVVFAINTQFGNPQADVIPEVKIVNSLSLKVFDDGVHKDYLSLSEVIADAQNGALYINHGTNHVSPVKMSESDLRTRQMVASQQMLDYVYFSLGKSQTYSNSRLSTVYVPPYGTVTDALKRAASGTVKVILGTNMDARFSDDPKLIEDYRLGRTPITISRFPFPEN